LVAWYTYFQNYLPLETLTKEVFTQWMELIRQIVDRPVPEVSGSDVDKLVAYL
jgi:hypothetical protein